MLQPSQDHLDVTVRVRPGASRQRVGGGYGDPPVLVVSVSAPAVDGRANEAVLRAVAEAFDVSRRDVHLMSVATSRTKVLRISGAVPALTERLELLLHG